jgi:hypothetical protein
MPEPEKLIPLHGGYRKLKNFEVAQLPISKFRMLAALRDALMPKLLSGELRVPAAAKLMEAKI